jgi:uncharacterized coiled-coil protein SlyX
MSSKIETELMAALDAHREALKLLGLPLGDRLEKAIEELHAAPAVERQPVAWATLVQNFRDEDRTVITDPVEAERYNSQCYALTPLYAEPTYIETSRHSKRLIEQQRNELAELQATNKRLTETIQHMIDQTIPLVPDENNPMWERRITIDKLQATIAQLTGDVEKWKGIAGRRTAERTEFMNERDDALTEIERLKGGQGEPVAWIDPHSIQRHSDNAKQWVRVSASLAENRANGYTQPLYTSQPAPVSVVPSFADGVEAAAKLVEKRMDDYVNEHGSHDPETGSVEFPGNGEEYVGELMDIIEQIQELACLDKVKELNS